MTSTLGAPRGAASGSPEPAATSSARPSLTRVLRAGTTPGRLWLLLVGLVALSLLWGAVAAWSVAQADSAATDMATASRSEEHSLNSSHPSISYAVFCLKKKKKNKCKKIIKKKKKKKIKKK